jgi:hypothetical protein
MIESAVAACRADRLPLPETLTPSLRADYAFVDFELMRESLDRYGLLPKTAVFKREAVPA